MLDEINKDIVDAVGTSNEETAPPVQKSSGFELPISEPSGIIPVAKKQTETALPLGQVQDKDYSWNEESKIQAGLKLELNAQEARNAAIDSASYVQKNLQDGATNYALGKYTVAQQVDKYGWQLGGSGKDAEYQTNFMKAAIAADLYNQQELQKLGFEGKLAAVITQYALDEKALAMEMYDREWNRELALAQMNNGLLFTPEMRQQLEWQQASKQTLDKYTNNIPVEGTPEWGEYSKALKAHDATKEWFASRGVSEQGIETATYIAWKAEEQRKIQQDLWNRVENEAWLDSLNKTSSDSLWVSVLGDDGLYRPIDLLASDTPIEELQSAFFKDGVFDESKLLAQLDKAPELDTSAIFAMTKKLGVKFEYEGVTFDSAEENPYITNTNLDAYNKSYAKVDSAKITAENVLTILTEVGDKDESYILGGYVYSYNATNGTWQKDSAASSGSESGNQTPVLKDADGNYLKDANGNLIADYASPLGTNYSGSTPEIGLNFSLVDKDGTKYRVLLADKAASDEIQKKLNAWADAAGVVEKYPAAQIDGKIYVKTKSGQWAEVVSRAGANYIEDFSYAEQALKENNGLDDTIPVTILNGKNTLPGSNTKHTLTYRAGLGSGVDASVGGNFSLMLNGERINIEAGRKATAKENEILAGMTNQSFAVYNGLLYFKGGDGKISVVQKRSGGGYASHWKILKDTLGLTN